MRFNNNCKARTKVVGPLSVVEMNNSMEQLVKSAQNDSFPTELTILKTKHFLPIKSNLLNLNPFLDDRGGLRVRGRLKNSSLSYDEKHPILLSGKNKLTRLIFQNEHLKLQHGGPQLLLFSVRQRFWPTSGMNTAKRIVKNCMRCARIHPKPVTSIMGDLPKHRVQISPPFSVTGLDYAGPLLLRDKKSRPYKTYKAYICLFLCFSTKCVHIELVTDLTTESFLTAFRRIAARRGTPNHLYS